MSERAMKNDDNSITWMENLPNGTTDIETFYEHNVTEAKWQELEALVNASPPPETPDLMTEEQLALIARSDFETQVTEERNRRIEHNFWFQGRHYQFDPDSKANIAGAATLAGFAVIAQPLPGFYRWHGGDSDFGWIDWDNNFTPMDANTTFDFGKAALDHNSQHIFAARALKEGPIVADIENDAYWP